MFILPLSLGWTRAAGTSVCLFKDNLEDVPCRALWRGIITSVENTSPNGLHNGVLCHSPYSSRGFLQPERCCSLWFLGPCGCCPGSPQTQGKLAVKSLNSQPSVPREVMGEGSKSQRPETNSHSNFRLGHTLAVGSWVPAYCVELLNMQQINCVCVCVWVCVCLSACVHACVM